MYIKRVKIQDIRGVDSLAIDFEQALQKARKEGAKRTSLAGWNVIAGPNGAGKSTLMQAMAIGLVDEEHRDRLIPDVSRWIRQTNKGRLQRKAMIDSNIITIQGDDLYPSEHNLNHEVKLNISWFSKAIFSHGVANIQSSIIDLSDGSTWKQTAIPPNGWLSVGYGPMRAVRLSQFDPEKEFANPRTEALCPLFRDDIPLIRAKAWACKFAENQNTKISSNNTYLIGIQRFLQDHLFGQDLRYTFTIEHNDIYINIDGKKISVESLGDGHYSLLLMVLDILMWIEKFRPGQLQKEFERWNFKENTDIKVYYSGVVFIDEVENHLHPQLQQQLGFWLKKHFPNIQFIVTTHSPLICQAADEAGLFRMDIGRDKLAPLDREMWISIVNGTTDNAIVTKLFGFIDPYSPNGRLLRNELTKIEIEMQKGVVPSTTIEQRKRLLSLLPDSMDYEVAASLRRLESRK